MVRSMASAECGQVLRGAGSRSPHEAVHQVHRLGQGEPRRIFLEGSEAALPEVLAGSWRRRGRTHMVLAIRLVHGAEQPGHPADARLDGGEAQAREAVEHPDAQRLATGSMVGESECET